MLRSSWALLIFSTVILLGANGPGGGGGSTLQVALSIPNEMAPPGGMVQMKFMVTQPTPISGGKPKAALNPTTFSGTSGIELFCPNGDLNGVAMVSGSNISMQYITTAGAQGADYPIMTMALPISGDAPIGSQTQFGLDPSSTWVLGTLGTATLKPMTPATVTVGGSISITNIVPGGGTLPAGTVVSIMGLGFQPKTQIQLNAIKASSITVVSPQLIQFTLAESINMTGQKIQVVNPDGSQDTYFSYMRGVPLFQSNQPLLAGALPIFSSMAYSAATFLPMAPATSSQFTGLAFQNPNLATSNVTISLFSPANALLGSATFTVPNSYRVMAETSELSGGAAPVYGSYAVVSATEPVEVFAFLADNSTGTITPMAAVSTQP